MWDGWGLNTLISSFGLRVTHTIGRFCWKKALVQNPAPNVDLFDVYFCRPIWNKRFRVLFFPLFSFLLSQSPERVLYCVQNKNKNVFFLHNTPRLQACMQASQTWIAVCASWCLWNMKHLYMPSIGS